MRALQVLRLDGPTGVEAVDLPDAEQRDGEVLVEVHAVGVSFPDLLLSQGAYQLKPEPPFTLGVDFAGIVRAAPPASGFAEGDRVACVLPYGGGAELVSLPPDGVFPLPDAVSFEAGAALPMNYLTAQFALSTRGGLRPGETVLVHGAAGGVGTAALQVAKGYGARTIAVVSTEAKGEVARDAGADEVVLLDGFLGAVKELTSGRGVDLVVDVVGGDLMTDSLRALGTFGRVLVIGFAAGGIPEVKVNRLLLNNIDVRGVGWGAYAMATRGFMRRQWDELVPMLETGVVDPPIGRVRAFEEMGQALADLAGRRTLGKSVLTLPTPR